MARLWSHAHLPLLGGTNNVIVGVQMQRMANLTYYVISTDLTRAPRIAMSELLQASGS